MPRTTKEVNAPWGGGRGQYTVHVQSSRDSFFSFASAMLVFSSPISSLSTLTMFSMSLDTCTFSLTSSLMGLSIVLLTLEIS